MFHRAASEIILTSANVDIVIKQRIRYTITTTEPGAAKPSSIQVFFFLNQYKVQHYFISAEGATSLNLETYTPTNSTNQPLTRADIEILLQEVESTDKLDLSWQNMRGIDLSELDLVGVNLSYANLMTANLSETNLSKAKLIGSNLCGANLIAVNLSEANLSEADLIGANCIVANLSAANLSRANLSRALLLMANLREAILENANLSGAYMCRANILDASFEKASLSGVILKDAYLYETEKTSLIDRGIIDLEIAKIIL